ncbi:MAG: DNA polymerase I [candidate division Zixibacteria bacterium]|nr:DNA polymerase I [candidate division Zixibacteria bacterium]
MNIKRKTVYLIDGSAMFYRAYFAFIRNPLINSKGENTSATFGFVNSLLKIIKDEQPDYLAVVWDTPHPTFRHKKYKEYKSTRAKMPDDLLYQLPHIRQVVEAFNIAHFEMEGFEADDVIGTLACKAEKAGFEVWCVTGDKDYFQLVSDKVGIYNPQSGSTTPVKMGPEEVRKKFGVPPELVIDKLALMGDSSDNVPGIPGIGPKTADNLLQQFESLDAILENSNQIKAKGTRKKVTENTEIALLSRYLVTIVTDVPIECDLDKLSRQQFDYEATKDLFIELEFTKLLKKILPATDIEMAGIVDHEQPKPTYKTVSSIGELKTLLKKMSESKEIAVDTETTSLDARNANLVGISLCNKANEAYYIPLGHNDSEANLPFDEAMEEIKKLLQKSKAQKFGQNIKYDLEVLHRYDIEIEPIGFDTMLASYIVDPMSRQHSLDFLATKYFDYHMQPINELIGKGKTQKSFADVPVNLATHYAAEDADYTFRLRGALAPKINEQNQQNLYYNIELPLVKVLATMEEEGIRVDTAFLGKLSSQIQDKLYGLMSKIFEIAGGEFNVNSIQQLSHILFEKLGLPTKGKTKKKTGYSTDIKVLEELALIHPFPKLILEYRQLTKLKNTYIDALPKMIDPNTGRVHTSFNQSVVATGRLSSTEPNLQNIPVRTEEGRQIRKAFVPRNDSYVLLVADYSQIELRLLAHMSDDAGLIKAFKKGEDIHSRTAAEVYGVQIDNVTSDQRRAAKTVNFAVIYGVSAFGLSKQIELDLAGSRQFINTYFERYPGIKQYIEQTKQQARDKGYAETMFGRRRNLPELHNRNYSIRQFAERVATNTPIQGTAADMIKIAMVRIHRKLSKLRSRMLLQVHDELVFDVHKDELDEIRNIIKVGMEKAVKLKVPVIVDIGVGKNWLEAK